MRLNEYGEIVLLSWSGLPNRYKNIGLDAFVIMPNHVHGIILINDANDVGAIGYAEMPCRYPHFHELPLQRHRIQRRRMLIPKVIGHFKMNSGKQINAVRGTQGTPVWQRNYYEHIIRNEDDLNEIRDYIIHNPLKWDSDTENPGYKK